MTNGLTDSTDLITEAIATGGVLPSGLFYFRPPLIINRGMALMGSPETTLEPLPGSVGNMVHLFTGGPEDLPPDTDIETHMPRGGGIRNIKLRGNVEENPWCYGVFARGARFTLENVTICNTYCAFGSNWLVDAMLSRCLFSLNLVNMYLLDIVTTLTVSACNIREARYDGITIQAGANRLVQGIVFTDNTIIESNGGYGANISEAPTPVMFDTAWFENNAWGPVDDPSKGIFRDCVIHGVPEPGARGLEGVHSRLFRAPAPPRCERVRPVIHVPGQ